MTAHDRRSIGESHFGWMFKCMEWNIGSAIEDDEEFMIHALLGAA